MQPDRDRADLEDRMQTMPSATEPTNPPPPSGNTRNTQPPDRGLAQLIVTTLLVVLSFSAGWFGNGYVNRNNYIGSSNDPSHKYQYVMNEAWNAINDNFVFTQNIDQQKMAYAAINAMVETLNDTGHTRFETPEEYRKETSLLQDNGTVGIGVELSGGGADPITITAVFPDTPASRGDLQAGDQIVAVDGTDVRGMTLDQVSPLIRGAEGTSVTLTIIRPSVSATAKMNVTMVRAKYTPPTAVSFIIPELNIADIQLIDFSNNADSQLRTELQKAETQHVSGIILDLRGNGGGYLAQAEAVTSEFVPAGSNKNVLIVRDRTSRTTYPVKPGCLAPNPDKPDDCPARTIPLAILIDHNTASAAEITAGAIAIDRLDAQTVGQNTYGTGTVLLPYTLADGSVLVLGTSEWLLPDGTSVYHKGVTPEQLVSLPAKALPLTPLSAPSNQATYEYIQKSNDTQLLQAIKDVQLQAASKPAA
jgi:carboxyl-terminal processing protease